MGRGAGRRSGFYQKLKGRVVVAGVTDEHLGLEREVSGSGVGAGR